MKRYVIKEILEKLKTDKNCIIINPHPDPVQTIFYQKTTLLDGEVRHLIYRASNGKDISKSLEAKNAKDSEIKKHFLAYLKLDIEPHATIPAPYALVFAGNNAVFTGDKTADYKVYVVNKIRVG